MKSNPAFILRFLVLSFLAIFIIFFPLRSLIGGEFVRMRYSKCSSLTQSKDKTICQRKSIKSAVYIGNVSVAVQLFQKSIRNNDEDCHSLGHQVGRDFYEIFRRYGFVRINAPLSECGYGFWHGLMTGFGEDSVSGLVDIDLKKVCPTILGKRSNIYDVCYHGFGIGFVGDPPKIEYWGNPQPLIQNASEKCFEVTQNPLYLEQCYSGVFHQTIGYMQNNEYKFSFPDQNELSGFCGKFGADKIKPCIEQLGPVMTVVLSQDVPKIVAYIKSKFGWLDTETKLRLLQTVVGGAVHLNNDDDTKKAMVYCFGLEENEVKSCLVGVFGGVKTKTRDGDVAALDYLIDLCNQKEISEDNQKKCTDFLVSSVKDPILHAEVSKACGSKKALKVCNLL